MYCSSMDRGKYIHDKEGASIYLVREERWLDEAQQLYKDLQQQGIDVWHDTANINFTLISAGRLIAVSS